MPIINNYDSNIAKIISEEHNNLKRIYGTIRLKHHIESKYKKIGLTINHKTIRRYKQALGLSVIVRKPKPLSVTNAKEKNLNNKAHYLIECNFKANEFGMKQSSDVSYIKCCDGTLYLSAIKDYFNKEIVSHSTSDKNDVDLIKASYKSVEPKEGKIINTDQGAVYFSYEYINLANELGFKRSMSNKGHCWENCPIENWFSQLKEEWLRPIGKITKDQAREEIKKYIQWYNTERIQKNLEYLSPVEYRLKYQK